MLTGRFERLLEQSQDIFFFSKPKHLSNLAKDRKSTRLMRRLQQQKDHLKQDEAYFAAGVIAQSVVRRADNAKVPGSIPGNTNFFAFSF